MTGARRNPSATRLVLPQEQECRVRALELSLLAGTIHGDVKQTAALYVGRAAEFASFIESGTIPPTEPGTTAPGP